jgi:hypothetical protein
MEQQTALDWFVQQLEESGIDMGSGIKMAYPIPYDIYKEAKAMEKERGGYTEEQGYEIWKAGQEYWKTSGNSITFEELIEKFKSKAILQKHL